MEGKPIKTEILWLLRTFGMDLCQNKHLKTVIFAISIFHLVLSIIQAFLFLTKFESLYFIKYCSIYVGILSMIFSAWIYSFAYNTATRALFDLDLWDIDSANTELKNQIQKEATYYNVILGMNLVMGFADALLQMVPIEMDKDIFYALEIFEQNFDEFWSNGLWWFYKTTLLLVVVILLVPCYITIYVLLHLKFQFYMFLHCLENVDSESQNEVKNRLKCCLQIYKQLRVTINRAVKEVSALLIFYSLMAIIICTSVICFYFSGYFTWVLYFRVGFIAAVLGIVGIHTILCGQDTENLFVQSGEVLKKLAWYQWSMENKKLYLNFLTYATKDVKLKISESTAINYSLGLSFLRIMFSMISVLRCLRNVHF